MMSSLPLHAALPTGKVAAGAIAWRYKGELRVTAIVKASFGFAFDTAMTRADAPALFTADVHHARNPLRSIVFASDLVPYRKRADVYFTGHAHAPGGATTDQLAARLGVAQGERVLCDKVLVVCKSGGFSRLPLLYEHARGGPGHENPYGEDEGSDDLHVLHPADPSRAAGFAPISPTMPARKKLFGLLSLSQLGKGVLAIPDGFDFDAFQAAPQDQQIPYLRGDEWILLERLNPAHPVLRMCLPGARAQARIHGLSAHGIPEGSTLAMNADTLHVIGDEQRCTVTWRGSFAVTSEAALGAVRIITGVETAGEPISWPDAAELARMIAASDATPGAAAAASTSTDGTIPLSSSDVEIVFSSSGDAAGTLALPPETTLPITSSATRAPQAPALPFRAVSIGERSAPALGGSPTRALQGSSGETLPLPDTPTPAARPTTLPFGKEPPAPEPPPSPEPVETKAPAPKVVWTRSHEEEEPAPAPPPRPAPPARPAPKVDVKNKLYGPGKKKG